MNDLCGHCGQKVKHVCLWCGKPAVAFCDAWIGGETVNGLFTINTPQYTCDAPVCADHRHTYGFVCGKSADTLDHCPVHEDDRVTVHSAATNKTEAESMRRAAWAEGNRFRIRTASSVMEERRSDV